MATQKLTYGSTTAFTLTGTSLGSFATREGTLVSNSTNLFVDIAFSGKVTVGAAVATGNCYLLASSSDATNISYPATGTDSTITISANAINQLGSLQYGQIVPGTELVFIATLYTQGLAAAAVVPFGGIWIAQAFGGNIPIGGVAPVIVNCQGQSFTATPANYVFNYTGLTYNIA